MSACGIKVSSIQATRKITAPNKSIKEADPPKLNESAVPNQLYYGRARIAIKIQAARKPHLNGDNDRANIRHCTLQRY